jgi:hypothetical protein
MVEWAAQRGGFSGIVSVGDQLDVISPTCWITRLDIKTRAILLYVEAIRMPANSCRQRVRPPGPGCCRRQIRPDGTRRERRPPIPARYGSDGHDAAAAPHPAVSDLREFLTARR